MTRSGSAGADHSGRSSPPRSPTRRRSPYPAALGAPASPSLRHDDAMNREFVAIGPRPDSPSFAASLRRTSSPEWRASSSSSAASASEDFLPGPRVPAHPHAAPKQTNMLLSQADLFAPAMSTSLLANFNEDANSSSSLSGSQEMHPDKVPEVSAPMSHRPPLPPAPEHLHKQQQKQKPGIVSSSSSLLQPTTSQPTVQNTPHASFAQQQPPMPLSPTSCASTDSPFLQSTTSIWDYIRRELNSDEFEESQDLKTERIKNFLNVPREIEKLMFVGYLICLDSFLYIFTILPLRISIALWDIVCSAFGGSPLKPAQKTDIVKGALVCICTFLLQFFDASRLYHAVRGQAIIKLYVIFNVLEICDKLCSAFGHDILDSLFSTSYSRWHATPATRRISRITHFAVATAYVFAHSLVLFYQVMTLNVAINSYNNALMTLLLSNQFVEIKSSVFKRFEKENLFQLSCSDIVERFQLSVFLVIIGVRNLLELIGGSGGGWVQVTSYIRGVYARLFLVFPDAKASWAGVLMLLRARPYEMMSLVQSGFAVISTTWSSILKSQELKVIEALVVPALLVYATEILVDWLKHAFITKFNGISPMVYEKYCLSLFRDLLGTLKSTPQQFQPRQHQNVSASASSSHNNRDHDSVVPSQMAIVDRSPIVARRIGFVSIPLACLVIRVTAQTVQMVGMLRAGEASETVIVGDAGDPDEIGAWRIPITTPRWLNVTWVSYFWDDSIFDVVSVAAWVIAVYVAITTFKLVLGIRLIRLARSRVDMSMAEATPSMAPVVSVSAPIRPIDLPTTKTPMPQSAANLKFEATPKATIIVQKGVRNPEMQRPPLPHSHRTKQPTPNVSRTHDVASTLISASPPPADSIPDISGSPDFQSTLAEVQMSTFSPQRFTITSPLSKMHDTLAPSLAQTPSHHGPLREINDNIDTTIPNTINNTHAQIAATDALIQHVPDIANQRALTPPLLDNHVPDTSYAQTSKPSAENLGADVIAHTEKTQNCASPSPSINEEKLDRIDRFTMVKSRIV